MDNVLTLTEDEEKELAAEKAEIIEKCRRRSARYKKRRLYRLALYRQRALAVFVIAVLAPAAFLVTGNPYTEVILSLMGAAVLTEKKIVVGN